MLPAEAGEDGGDARHQLGEGGPPLRLRMPALDHHGVAGGRREEVKGDSGRRHRGSKRAAVFSLSVTFSVSH